MIEKLDILASKLANQKTIRALRRGLLYLMPLILIGSIILVVINLPVPVQSSQFVRVLGCGLSKIGLPIYKATLQTMALTALITVSYALSKEKELVKSGEVNSIVIVITAFASFIAFSDNTDVIIEIGEAGSAGLFKALVISVLTCKLFCFFYKCHSRIWTPNASTYNAGVLIRSSFRSVVPALLTILVFSTVKMLFGVIGLDSVKLMLLKLINETWLTGQNYFSAVIIIVITHILWFLGIHGGNVVMDTMSAATPELSTVADASVFTKGFFDTYVFLGGAGATLGLLIALLLVRRNSNEFRLAKISAIPAVFNINETLIYGLPIIFNIYYFVPFLLSPAVLSFTAWISVRLGWAPPITQSVEWTTPIFLSGYFSTGSMAGVLMQAANLILAALIYLPFIRLQQRNYQRDSVTTFKKLTNKIQYVQALNQTAVFNCHDEIGYLARTLAAELKYGFKNNMIPLHLEYQPKTNKKGEVMGAEALLRWTHPVYGHISPIVTLYLCDEAGLTNELGSWVIKQAFSDLQDWHQQGYSTLTLSVNLNPRQLRDDKMLVKTIQSCINHLGLEPGCMELELTENATIDQSDNIRDKLECIKGMGMNLSIDDFGMGHSSLLYLCDSFANIVKIDASLVRTITTDIQRQHIIKSIISLCEQLDIKAVAEGVETGEQVDMLYNLGCRYFQGFYFSRSLSCEQFLEYVVKKGCI